MYWQLNITTNKSGKPECVLIRALEPVTTNKYEYTTNITNKNSRRFGGKFVKIHSLANGPGKLCRWMKLDKSFDGEDLTNSKRIWLEDRGEKILPFQIIKTKRIGIDYAGSWAKNPWRFYIPDNQFVSRKLKVPRSEATNGSYIKNSLFISRK
jgi:DNA-3-methyladenine glycosylase